MLKFTLISINFGLKTVMAKLAAYFFETGKRFYIYKGDVSRDSLVVLNDLQPPAVN